MALYPTKTLEILKVLLEAGKPISGKDIWTKILWLDKLNIHSRMQVLVSKGLVEKIVVMSGSRRHVSFNLNYGKYIIYKEKAEQLKTRKRRTKAVYAVHKPCAKCKVKARVIKSYCRECWNINSRVTAKKIYDRKRKERLLEGMEEYSL